MNDSNGERTMKLWGNTVPMDVNAGENRFANFNEYTVYPSPYVVADVHGYTKHYYAGTERLCSRIGGGGLQELHYSPVDDGYVEKKEDAYRNLINEDLRCAGARAETRELNFEMLHRLFEIVEPETKIYYYHSDHLGSASWITDSSGQAVQHMQYLPYGETKLDQRTSSYNERYTFSGKEKDSETGYYYFGARYYNSDLSLWLSVDPMSDKYPSLSPYNYCAWNPMKIVDPDGREVDNYLIFENGMIFKEETNDNTNTYTYIRSDGTEVDLGTYSVSQNDVGEDMVAIGDKSYGENNHFSWAGINSGNLFFEEDAFAGLLGGIQNFYDGNTSLDIKPVRFNQLMSKNRVHSGKPNRHSAIDIAFYSSNGRPGAHADRPSDHASIKYNTSLLNSLKLFGLGSNNVFTSIDRNGSKPFLDGTKALANHHHHMHLQGFAGRVLPLLEIIEQKQY